MENSTVCGPIPREKTRVANAETQSVLYVGDYPANRTVLEAVIRYFPNFRLKPARSARCAHEITGTFDRPAVVVFEQDEIGHVETFETLRTLRELWGGESVPAIVISGGVDQSALRSSGVAWGLCHPLRSGVVIAVLRELLGAGVQGRMVN